MRNYVRNCVDCVRTKARQPQPAAPQRATTSNFPFETISIDILGPYLLTRRKNKYIIVVRDIFTRWIEAKAFHHVDAKTLTQYLEEDIISRFGSPK